MRLSSTEGRRESGGKRRGMRGAEKEGLEEGRKDGRKEWERGRENSTCN